MYFYKYIFISYVHDFSHIISDNSIIIEKQYMDINTKARARHYLEESKLVLKFISDNFRR